MGETHVISALERKRSHIAGELVKTEKVCDTLRQHLFALDAALRIFAYDGDPADIKPIRPCHWMFRRGELRRTVIAILRTADGPVSNRDIAARVIEMKGWDEADVTLRRKVAEKIKDVRKRLAP